MTHFDKKNQDLEFFLDNFVKTFQSSNDEDLVNMETTKLVLENMDNNTSLNDFEKIINNKGFSKTATGLFFCNFDKDKEINIIQIVDSYNGLYHLHLNSSFEEEYNEIYAVFCNPLDTYKCLLEIQKLNIQDEHREGLEDLSHILHM